MRAKGRPGAERRILDYAHAGRAREMGLGSMREVSLVEARECALAARKLLREGIDPIGERRRQRHSARFAAERRRIIFADAAKRYIAAHAAGWRNPKHRQQWSNTLTTYANPILGQLYSDQIETAHVIRCLEPIWTTKTETATRVRQRIEAVLSWCTARGFREGDNPARWDRHLENLLPKPGKVSRVEHFAAIPGATCRLSWRTTRRARHGSEGARVRDPDRGALGRSPRRYVARVRP